MGKHGDKDNLKDNPKGGDGNSPQGGKRGSGGDGGGNKGDGKNPK